MRTNDWKEPAESRMGVPTDLLNQKKELVQIWSQLRAGQLDLTDLVEVFEQQGIRFIKHQDRKQFYPKYSTAVAASFGMISASDADAGGYEETDLVSELIQNPDRTIVLEVVGDSMRDAGILPGNILVVETPDTDQKPWLQPTNRAFVIA